MLTDDTQISLMLEKVSSHERWKLLTKAAYPRDLTFLMYKYVVLLFKSSPHAGRPFWGEHGSKTKWVLATLAFLTHETQGELERL